MKLYEINEQIAACTDPETGEVLDVERLTALEIERDQKLENVALWIKDLTAQAVAIRAEEIALSQRRKAAENKAQSLREWLTAQLCGERFETARVSVRVKNNPEKPVFEDEDAFIRWAQKCDDDLLRYPEPEIDRAEVRRALMAGWKHEGVRLERTQSVVIK